LVFADDPESDLAQLDRAAASRTGRDQASHSLTRIADSATRWVWLSNRPDVARVAHVLRAGVVLEAISP
jgi:hypothetical protein